MLQEVEEKRIILYYKNIDSNEKVRIMISKPSTYEQLLKKIYLTLEINPKQYHVDLYILPSFAIIFPGNFFLVRDNDIIQLELEPIKYKRIITESGNEERKRAKKSVENTVNNNKNKEKENQRVTIDVEENAHEEMIIKENVHQEIPKEMSQKETSRQVIITQNKNNNKEDELDRLEKELEKELKDMQEKNKQKLDERSMNILTDSQLDYASLTPPHVEDMESKMEKRKEKNARKVIDIKKTPPRVEKILDTPQNSPQRTDMLVENSPVVVPSSKKTNNKRKKDDEEDDENWEPSQDGDVILGRKESEEDEEIVKESPPKKIKQTQKPPTEVRNTKRSKISPNKDTKTSNTSKSIIANNTKKNRVIETEDSPIKKNPSSQQDHNKKLSNKKVKFSVKIDDDDDYIDSSSFEESDNGHYYPPLIDESSSEKEPKNRPDRSSSEDSYSPAKKSIPQTNVLFVDDVSRDDQQDYDSSSPIRETRISDFCKKNSSPIKSPTKFVQQKNTSKSPSPSKSIWTREELMKKVHFSSWSELREIAKKLGVKAKGTKDDLRQKLLRRIKYSI